MASLKAESPELHRLYLKGGLTVHLGDLNPFVRLPIDQTLEETVNNDSQTTGVTKGFSLKSGAVGRYYLTAVHRAEALRRLRDLIVAQKPRFGHPDIQESRIKRVERDVLPIVEMLEEN